MVRQNFVQLFLLIGLTAILISSVDAHAQRESFQCALDQTIFFHRQCHTCLNRRRSEVTASTNIRRPPLNLSDMLGPHQLGFSSCPKSLSDFTAGRVRRGALALNGQELGVVTIQRPPFTKVVVDAQGQTSYSGVVFEFLYTMDDKLNFSMRIITSPDGNWGHRNLNGSWNGMIGVILRKEAELGAASFSVTLDRARVVDFTTSFHQEPTSILIPAPTEGEKLTILIRPLSPEVWLGLGLCVVVIVPTFYALHVFSLSIHSQKEHPGKRTFLWILSRLALYITGSLVQESVVSPLEKRTRLLVAIWWMVTLVMANTYVAILVSFLAVPKLQNLVDSLEELAAQTQLSWTFRMGTAHYSLFKSDTSMGVFKEIGDGVTDEQLAKSDFDGVAQVLTGHWAFIKEKSFLDVALGNDFAAHGKCRLTLAKHEFFTVGIGLVVPKNSVYLPLWDYEISNAVATGLMEKWKELHWPRNLHCADAERYIRKTRPKSRKLGLIDVQGVFLILVFGILVSTCVLLAERFLHSTTLAAKRIQASQREKSKQTPWIFLK